MSVVALAATCVGQGTSESGVESTVRAIQGGSLMGTGGIGFAAKIDQAMSDGKRLICSGAFISPHVVLTAAHCTRNYDYGSTITPTTDTVIRYGAGFANAQKIAGDEKVGWRELGSTDIGLYRVAQAVPLPIIPKLYRSCGTANLVGGRVVVYGRMINGTQAPTAEYYMSPERTVRAVAKGVGANGNYLQTDSTTDAGDSGGPWVYSQDRIVAVTHTSEYGSRFCDVASEVETQVNAWGDTLTFVEDSGGGLDGGSAGQGGVGSGDAASRSGGAGGSGATDSGGVGSHAGASGAAGGTSGTAGRSGFGGAGGTVSQTGAGGAGESAGGREAGGSAGGASGSNAAGSTAQASTGAGGGPGRVGGAQGGAGPDAQATAGAGGTTGRRTDSGTTNGQASSGCSCRTPGAGRHASPLESLVLFAAIAWAITFARCRTRRR
jgi:V8-like Glu-specific endopeptidase